MKLDFERHIESQYFTNDVNSLFEESVKCYKTSTYRASMLFSYLAFLTILKERIIKAQLPAGIPQTLWEKIQRDLQDEEGWDKGVFDSTQRKSPAPIFAISDSIRRQIEYWKDRRNDCAHYKAHIDHSHVEAFWQFLISYLPKLMVNGSKEALLNKIDIHFNPSFTPVEQDYSYIIEEIEHAIEQSDLIDFFKDVNEIISERLGTPWFTSMTKKLFEFYNSILSRYSNIIAEKLVNYIKSEKDLLLEFLRQYPGRLTLFKLDNSEIRNLWYDKLFSSHNNDFPIYCALLRNNMISETDISSANERIIKRGVNATPKEAERIILEENGFFTTLREKAFVEEWIDEFNWANENGQIIKYYLENYRLDEVIVKAICTTFERTYHPFDLRDALNSFFIKYLAKRDEFIKIAKKECYLLPKNLSLLKDKKDSE